MEELGWPVIAVLKQERFEVHQEALALSQSKPDQVVEHNERRLEIWDIRSLRLRRRIYRSLFCGCPLRLFSG